MAELWSLIHEQRRQVGDMLGTLSDADWDASSLCAGWRVRDVVAHMIETHQMTPGTFVVRFAGAGFSLNTMSEKNIARHRSDPPAQLLAVFRETAPRSTAPPGPKPTWLAEAFIHGEDVARATGKSVSTSPQVLVAVADHVRATGPVLHAKQRSAGLRLRATDVDWSAGDGPEVSGPAGSLILAITGRSVALADLSGDGLETLRSRM